MPQNGKSSDRPELLSRLNDSDAGVRYWALTGLLVEGRDAYEQATKQVLNSMHDDSASVRIVAAELVGRYGNPAQAKQAVDALFEDANYQHTSEQAATAALLVLDELGNARPDLLANRKSQIRELPLPSTGKNVNPRVKEYPSRLQTTLLKEAPKDQ